MGLAGRVLLLLLLSVPAQAEALLIGSGSQAGVYYQAASAICQVLNQADGQAGACRGRPTPGSVFNLQAVQRGLLDLGIVQSDRLWEAVHGAGQWQGKPVTGVRSLFSLHAEAIMLVARQDSGIQELIDIRGKRINIGNPGSGHRTNAEDLIRLHGLLPGEDFSAFELQQDRASQALVNNRLDAFFYTVGNPSAAIAEPAQLTPIRIIPLSTSAMVQMLEKRPYLVPLDLPEDLYPGVDKPVPTLGPKAILVADETMDEATVYDLVRQVFEHLDTLQGFHPALQHLSPNAMLQGLSAPLHPGAQRYFEAQGMLDPAMP